MANRRKFLAGIGALASGSAAAVGTGAFSSVEASRSVSVDVEGDSDAFLAISSLDTDRATSDGDSISLNFEDGNNDDDFGLNPNAETTFREIIEITNQSNDDAVIGADASSVNNLSGIDRLAVFGVKRNSDEEIPSQREDGSGNPEGEARITDSAVDFSGPRPLVTQDDPDDKVTLTPGESMVLSFLFETLDDPNEELSDTDAEVVLAGVDPSRTTA